jgi:hypothetical protein
MDGCQARRNPNARAFELVKAALEGDLRLARCLAAESTEEAREAARRVFGASRDQDVT